MGGGLSRRTLLTGALGLGALAACSPSPQRARGPATSAPVTTPAQRHTPSWTQGVLHSDYVPFVPRWRMALPSTPPVGLLVALHGHGGNADSVFNRVRLGDHVERTRLAVVSVDAGVTYYHRRRSGTDAGAMVVDDLIPLALDRAGLAPDAPLALYGWSMGGFGALHLAAQLGARVSCVVAVSCALWLRETDVRAGAFDSPRDYRLNSIFGKVDRLAATPVRLDCGVRDEFIAANRILASRLARVEATFDAGAHDHTYWRTHAGPELDWVARHLA